MNELFNELKDKIIKIRGYKIGNKTSIIKMILFDKSNVCVITKDDEIKFKWNSDDCYIILVDRYSGLIKSYLTKDESFIVDLNTFDILKTIKEMLIEWSEEEFDWEEEIS